MTDEDFDAVMARKDEIGDALNKIGFLYVTLDLEGYRTGSMNEGLVKEGEMGETGETDFSILDF